MKVSAPIFWRYKLEVFQRHQFFYTNFLTVFPKFSRKFSKIIVRFPHYRFRKSETLLRIHTLLLYSSSLNIEERKLNVRVRTMFKKRRRIMPSYPSTSFQIHAFIIIRCRVKTLKLIMKTHLPPPLSPQKGVDVRELKTTIIIISDVDGYKSKIREALRNVHSFLFKVCLLQNPPKEYQICTLKDKFTKKNWRQWPH